MEPSARKKESCLGSADPRHETKPYHANAEVTKELGKQRIAQKNQQRTFFGTNKGKRLGSLEPNRTSRVSLHTIHHLKNQKEKSRVVPNWVRL